MTKSLDNNIGIAFLCCLNLLKEGFYVDIAYLRKDLRMTLEMFLERPGGQTELWYNCSPNNDETFF